MRPLAHIVEILEHQFGLLWHAHATIIYVLHGRDLIRWVLQVVICIILIVLV